MVSAIEKMYTEDDLIKIIKSNGDKYFDGYFVNKKNEIEHEMAKYPEKIKKKMLFRSICYYIVEKEYIKYDEIPDVVQDMKLQPTDIIRQLQGWERDRKPIEKMLDDFDEYNKKELSDVVKFQFKIN